MSGWRSLAWRVELVVGVVRSLLVDGVGFWRSPAVGMLLKRCFVVKLIILRGEGGDRYSFAVVVPFPGFISLRGGIC